MFSSILNNQDIVIAKSNQNEGGRVVKLRLVVVNLFVVKFKINLIKKDYSCGMWSNVL